LTSSTKQELLYQAGNTETVLQAFSECESLLSRNKCELWMRKNQFKKKETVAVKIENKL
jgi:hypothetical protein